MTRLINVQHLSPSHFLNKVLENISARQLQCPTFSNFRLTRPIWLEGQCVFDVILTGQASFSENYFFLLAVAFDTLDHYLLSERLCSFIGQYNTAFNWLRSYLSERIQSVFSCEKRLDWQMDRQIGQNLAY